MAAPQWMVNRLASFEPSPLDAMIKAEDADREARKEAELRREAQSPTDRFPTLVLMGSHPWPVPDDTNGQCGTCHGMPKPGHYCLCCDTPRGSMSGMVKYQPKIAEDTEAVKAKGGKRAKGKAETRKEKRAKKGKREAA